MGSIWARLSRESIATRLFLSAFFWCVVILVVAGVILSTVYRRISERAFDERLQVYLTDLASDLVAPGDFENKEIGPGESQFKLPLSGWYWQVSRVGGTAPSDTRASPSLVGAPLKSLSNFGVKAELGDFRKGYMVGPDERSLRVAERVIDLGEEGRFLTEVAAPADEIDNVISQFRVALVLTFVLLGAALMLSSLLQARFALAPLSRLHNAIADIRRGDAEHIEGEYPPDVRPVSTELNLLIDANREILERARTQVGNLAHALKTPLSVMVNEADASAGQLSDKVREQAGIMRDQVNYYLDRARAAAVAGALGRFTDVEPVIDGLVRALEKIYGQRGLTIHWTVPAGTRFRGERHDFEDMVGNLADNACKWAAGRVEIAVRPDEEGDKPQIHILVDDDGPGLSPEDRAEVIRRGRRLDETKPGSGLGLAIVAELAELYGGELSFDTSPLGGLRVMLRVPGV
jgi:signal transduction histidine kinase